MQAISSAIQQGADLPQFAAATVVNRDQAIDFCRAASAFLDAAQSAAEVRLWCDDQPEWTTLFTLTGAARCAYVEALGDDALGTAVGALAGGIQQLLRSGVRFQVRAEQPAQAPQAPLEVRIVEQPDTIATHRVLRDQSGQITSTVVTTTAN
jgi:hypothetical protein